MIYGFLVLLQQQGADRPTHKAAYQHSGYKRMKIKDKDI
jgi:hypothetical protein